MPDVCDVMPTMPQCLIGEAAGALANSMFEDIAESAGEWAGSMLVRAMTWWVQTPSVNPDNPAVAQAQQWVLPLALFMLVGSVLWQAGRLILARDTHALANIGSGLVRYAVVTALAVTVMAGALKAGDALAQAMMDDTAQRFGERMKDMLTLAVVTNPVGLLLVGIVLGLAAVIQWVIGLLRQAGILILAALIPVAASGSLNEATKAWWPKLGTTALALVVYKPCAAFIYMIGFTFMSSKESFTTVMVGAMVLVLALFALPALLKFFSWAETSIASSGGAASGGFMGAAGALAMAGGGSGGGGGGGGSPASQASAAESTGPGSAGGSAGDFGAIPGAAPSGGGSSPDPGGAASTSGAASGGSAGGFDGPSAGGQAAASGGGEAAASGAAGGASGGAAAAGGPAGAVYAAGQAGKQAADGAAGEMTSGVDGGEEGGETR